MKFNQTTIHFALTLLLSANGYSQTTESSFTGDGSRGGGEVVNKNGKKTIRDMADPTAPEVISGGTILNENKIPVNAILASIQPYDYFLYTKLKDEFIAMKFMFTKNLKAIDTDDEDSFTYADGDHELIAVRDLLTKVARVDRDEFKQLDPKLKAYILLHESFHSQIEAKAPLRNEKVRGFGKLIFSIYEGVKVDRNDYYASLDAFGIQTIKDPLVQLAAKLSESRYPIKKSDRTVFVEKSALEVYRVMNYLSPEREKAFAKNTGIIKQIAHQKAVGIEKELVLRKLKGSKMITLGACFLIPEYSLDSKFEKFKDIWFRSSMDVMFYNPYTKQSKTIGLYEDRSYYDHEGAWSYEDFPVGMTIESVLLWPGTYSHGPSHEDRNTTDFGCSITNLVERGFCDVP